MLWLRLLHLGYDHTIYVATIKCASIMQEVSRKQPPQISEKTFSVSKPGTNIGTGGQETTLCKDTSIAFSHHSPWMWKTLIMQRGKRHFYKTRFQKFRSLDSTVSYFFLHKFTRSKLFWDQALNTFYMLLTNFPSILTSGRLQWMEHSMRPRDWNWGNSRVYVIIRHRCKHLPMRSTWRRKYFDVNARSIVKKGGHLDPGNVKLYSSMGCIHE